MDDGIPPPVIPAPALPAAARGAAAHVFVADMDAPELGPEDRHHLERVLRLKTGELVSVADGRGRWQMCTYAGVGASVGGGRGSVGLAGRLEPVGEVSTFPRAAPEIAVGFALTKGDRPEWAVQKLTEIGVDRIVPLVTDRSVVRWDGERAERHLGRLREVARLAAMQSRRLRLPEITPVRAFHEVCREPARSTLAVAVPGGDPPTLSRPTVLIGPEGGWTDQEEEEAPATLGLGPTVLRTETAAVFVGALLAALRTGLVFNHR